MSNSVTLLTPGGPMSPGELVACIQAAFQAFDLPPPEIRGEQIEVRPDGGFGPVLVEGFGVVDECQISVTPESAGSRFTISTGMDWQLVALVAYGICDRAGGTLQNDANKFDRQPTYSAKALERYIREETNLTRDKAIASLRKDVALLADGMIHPDMLVLLFIRQITRLQDPSLIDLAPTDVQERIRTVVAEFGRDGEYILYSRNGPVDHSRAVRELARLLATR